MAICYARLEFVKRSSGKVSVAKAAYNGKLKLEFEGNCIAPRKTYDWTWKGEHPISHSVLLPAHVEESFRDPQKLWNLAEHFEKRKDAQVGKEVVIALPDDKMVTDAQRVELANEFAKKYFVSKGYAVQVDVHAPSQYQSFDEETNEKMEDNEKNFHAHLLITARRFSEDGKSFENKKCNDLNPEIRGSTHYAFGGLEWPKLWTQFQNEYYEEKGLDLRVDQKGVLSEVHLGPIRMRGKGAYPVLDAQENRQQVKDPNILLDTIAENKCMFSESEFEAFLQKNVSDNLRDSAREAFWKNPNLVQLFDKESHQPTTKFTSTEIVDEEKKILRLADRIQQRKVSLSKGDLSPSQLNHEQTVAFNKIIHGNSLSCIEGLAGTGKSFLLVALKDYYESHDIKVRAFGPDNATVKVLQEKGFTDVSNVHRFLFKTHFTKKNPILPDKEVWIIDESSKLGNRPLLELLKSAEKNNIQVIFSGNSAQLSSVERGGMFKTFCNHYGHAFLQEIQRQKSENHREISKSLAYGKVAPAVDMISSTGGFVWCRDKEEVLLRTVEKWAEDRLHFPYASSLIIAHTNNEVRQINDLVHTIRLARGEIDKKEFECNTPFGKICVSEGDLLEFRSNPKNLKVTNGDVGVLTSASKNKFVVEIGGKEITFDPEKFTSFQLAYAATYFRSQGRTIDRSYIVYHPQMHQKLLYVGMTRHVRHASCFVSKTDAKCLMDLKRQVIRKSNEVENTLNYTTASEIEKLQKSSQREKTLQEFYSSDSLLTRTKGYGLKAWDSLKSGIDSMVERVQDRRIDNSFYVSPIQPQVEGHVAEIKEKLNSRTEISIEAKNTPPSQSNTVKKNDAFRNLPEDKKVLYKKYFEESDKASTLYSVVQAEASSSSIPKDLTPSFRAWQTTCVERNLSAFELSKSKDCSQAILGKKGLEILQDRARIYEKSQMAKDSKDSVETKLEENIDNLLYRLFPDGPHRKDSRGYRFGSKGSLLVTCVGKKKGCFYNFETKEGGNLLKLIEKKEGLTYSAAISWAKEFVGEYSGKPAPSHFSTANFKVKEENWISMAPPAQHKLPPLSALSRYLDVNYNLGAIHPYHNAQGEVVCYTLRLEPKGQGKKIVLPLSYGKNNPNGELHWNLKNHEAKKELLYNMPMLNKHPEKAVLIVEGEKTADAAQKLFGKDYVVVTWSGGASAASDANWKLLFGRDAVVWPDNDPAGFKAASDIGRCLRHVGVKSLKVVNTEALKDFPLKWDLADPLPEGKSFQFIQNRILRAESKAIGMERLTVLADQYRIPFNQLNEIACNVDDSMRLDLEKKHGSKTWEVEASILSATTKLLNEKHSLNRHSIFQEQSTHKENGKSQGYEREFG